MTWRPLSSFVSTFRAAPQPPGSALRERAAALALAVHGERVMELPALVNVAALALSLPRLEVHEMSPGAIRAIHASSD